MRRCFLLFFHSWLLWGGIRADSQAPSPAFDLIGPKVDVHVKRGEITLPIGQVPNLMPGDRLWIHPDLPESQSTRYLLIVAFLRGATNPPPSDWFTKVDTWTKQAREEGVFISVPAEAQQAVVFLAPETGGDFNTLRAAVRGRPGTFVRASQDLQAASLDRMRLDAYLDEVKVTSQTDPTLLKERAERAARSLGIQVNQQCFDKPTEQQAPCLVQHTDGVVMDDANTSNRVAQLTSGSNVDLMNQLSYSSVAGAGAYSPYVGAILDTARILASLHTAHFQYIPALALPTKDTLNLRLNTPPSFRDPKSVVVVALPPVGAAKLPPLHPLNPGDQFCAQKPGLVLPAEGAPLVYATQMANSLVLHINAKPNPIDLPLRASPGEGGLVLDRPAPLLPRGDMTGVVRGKWGFDDWEGPHFRLHSAREGAWNVAAGDQSALVVGREDTVHIEDENSLCVEKITAQAAGATPVTLSWKALKPETIEVAVPLKDAQPGPVTLEVRQFGLDKPDKLTLTAYSEAASIDHMTFSVGDTDAMLTGTRLDEVSKASLNGINWAPTALNRVQDVDRLVLKADSPTTNLEAGKHYSATVLLRDGRQLKTKVMVEPPRPEVTLLSKGTQEDTSADPSAVHFGSPDDFPVERRFVFFLKSRTPLNFPRDEKVEVAAVDGSFRTLLSLNDGSLMLEDANTALGVVEPLARFGLSAFGPVQARAVSAEGVTGDWLPLGTLVRVPGFKELRCPRTPSKPCILVGSNLFLIAYISATRDFENPTEVPLDFTGTQIQVPHPVNGVLYLRLRDDPDTVQTLAMAATPAMIGPAGKLAQPTSPASSTTDAQGSSGAAPPPSAKPEP